MNPKSLLGKPIRFILLLGILLTGRGPVFSQILLKKDTSIQACAGQLLDSGGLLAGYSLNEAFTVSICPDRPGSGVRMLFTKLQLGVGDTLRVFNGAATPDALLGEWTNTSADSLFLQATVDNPAGCLLLTFISDKVDNQNGWVAELSCGPLCQPVLLDTLSLMLLQDKDLNNRVLLCPGAFLNEFPKLLFPQNKLGYLQAEESTTFQWELGDGNQVVGRSLSYGYTQAGVYDLRLRVTDAASCETQFEVAEIFAIPSPGMVTAALTPEICIGTPISWLAGVGLSPEEGQIQLIPASVDLPEGTPWIIDITQVKWRFSPDFVEQQQGRIKAVPTHPGLATYQLLVTDTLGCTHELPFTTHILPEGSTSCSDCLVGVAPLPDLEVCAGDSLAVQITAQVNQDSVFTFQSNPQYLLGASNHPVSNPYSALLPVEALPFAQLSRPLEQLKSVCLTLYTDWDEDITAVLQAPSGEQVRLFAGVGGGADDFINTCFSPSASTPIGAGNAPFTGTYAPQGDWGALSNASALGNWALILSDSFGPMQLGRLESWQLTFTGTNEVHYSWNSGNGLSCLDCASQTITPTASDTYTYEVRDSKGCFFRDTFQITVVEQLEAPEVNCDFNRSGQAEFSWNPVLGATAYKVGFQVNGVDLQVDLSVSDTFFHPADFFMENDVLRLSVEAIPGMGRLDCGSSAGLVGCIFEACRVQSDILSIEPARCYGQADGIAVIGASGGFPPYQYQLDGMGALQLSNRVSGLAAGEHFVVVFDATSCADTVFFTITEPLPILAQVEVRKPIRCSGDKTAVLQGSAQGGIGTITYSWSNGSVGSSLAGVGAGKYILAAVDSKGCAGKDSVFLTNPPLLLLEMKSSPILCAGRNDGAIRLEVNGGEGSYRVEWQDGTLVDSLVNLGAGTYCVTISDDNGCIVSNCLELISPEPLEIDSTIVIPVDCSGRQTGEVWLFMKGGSLPYSYRWGDPLGQTGPLATLLNGGPVSLAVTDAAGCVFVDTILVPEPAVLEVQLVSDSVRCRDGSDGRIKAVPLGGTAPFDFRWNTGNTVSDALVGLEASRYSVTVTDVKGCKAFAQGIVSEPEFALEAKIVQLFQGCFGAGDNKALVEATGGNGNYTYRWNTGEQKSILVGLDSALYSVTVSDSKGCLTSAEKVMVDLPPIVPNMIMNAPYCFGGSNGEIGINFIEGRPQADFNLYQFQWNTGATGPIVGNLAGDRYYSVTVTDPIGCTAVTTRFLRQPQPISVVTAHADVQCAGGSDGKAWVSSISADGSQFTYRWELSTGIVESDTATGLSAGTYRVLVTDERGCYGEARVSVGQPAPLAIKADVRNNKCIGDLTGLIQLSGIGGTGAYKWYWSDGGSGSQRGQLKAGYYSVTLTDTHGCAQVASYQLVPESNIVGVIEVVSATCHGARDGVLEVAASGGVPPYAYSLDGESYRQTPYIIGLGAGTYDVYIRDANGCRVFERAKITEPGPFTVDAGPESYSIVLGDTLLLYPTSAGGQGLVAFEWQAPYEGTLSCTKCSQTYAFPHSTISYELIGRDSVGCTSSDRITIHVAKDRVILVPTGFTPNADGTNDRLLVHGLAGTKILKFLVFDRWGALVFEGLDFETNQEEAGWDGKMNGMDASPGVYVWYLEAEYPDGFREHRRGQTTLIR